MENIKASLEDKEFIFKDAKKRLKAISSETKKDPFMKNYKIETLVQISRWELYWYKRENKIFNITEEMNNWVKVNPQTDAYDSLKEEYTQIMQKVMQGATEEEKITLSKYLKGEIETSDPQMQALIIKLKNFA